MPKLRRTLRNIDAAMGPAGTSPVKDEVRRHAVSVLGDMLQGVRYRTGRLAGLLRFRVSRDGLTARVGLITKRAQRLGFHAWFQEFGTGGSKERNIPPQPAEPFMGPAAERNRAPFVRAMRRAIDKVLRRAAR